MVDFKGGASSPPSISSTILNVSIVEDFLFYKLNSA